MKEVPLTNGMVALIDDIDEEEVRRYQWRAEERRDNGLGYWYAVTGVGKRTIRMHQLILPGAPRVDHRDNDGLNNRRDNLRPATQKQNITNARKRTGTVSRFKGVGFNRMSPGRPWFASITNDGRKHYLGAYATEEDAAAAYNVAATRIFGEFARLNEVSA